MKINKMKFKKIVAEIINEVMNEKPGNKTPVTLKENKLKIKEWVNKKLSAHKKSIKK